MSRSGVLMAEVTPFEGFSKQEFFCSGSTHKSCAKSFSVASSGPAILQHAVTKESIYNRPTFGLYEYFIEYCGATHRSHSSIHVKWRDMTGETSRMCCCCTLQRASKTCEFSVTIRTSLHDVRSKQALLCSSSGSVNFLCTAVPGSRT